MIPGNINTDLISGADEAAYQISRSLRFNSADSAFLSRTPASAGNRKTWTWAGWVKRSGLGQDSRIFSAATSGSNQAGITFNTDNTIEIFDYQGAYGYRKVTTQVFRDASAWYHFCLVADFDNATAEDRLRFFVNGVRVTVFSTNTNPSSGYATGLINSAIQHGLSAYTGPAAFFNGYLADIHFIDGQALTPSSFAETNATTGQWVPKAYTGSYGTNGFRLDFSNPVDLGNDAAGANDWTPSNLSGVSGGPTSVAAASGALPIYNTTDTYGTTKGTGTRTDTNASSLVLAIPMDGTNNGTTFTDESTTIKGSGSAKTISRLGDTKTSTAQSKYYGSSGYFDGAGDYLSVGSSADYLFGNGDFTIESWFYLTTNSVRQDLCGNYSGASTGWGFSLGSASSGMYFYYGNNVYAATSSNIWSVNRWNHVAIARSSSVLRIYLNGIQVSSETVAVNISTTSYATLVGAVTDLSGNPQLAMNGYLQDFRIYKGVAKYTSSFNPPTSTQNPTVAAGNDSLVDTPTSYGTDTGAGGEVRGNYATLNPLHSYVSLASNGNLDCNSNGSGWIGSTIHVTTGKWYAEFTVGSTGNIQMFGVCTSTHRGSGYPWQASTPGVTYYVQDGRIYVDGVNTGTTTGSTNGDIISLSFDVDAKSVVVRKNDSILSTKTIGTTSSYMFFISDGGGNATSSINFGQRPFAYTAPSGFKALCDTNLPAPTIARPSTVMDVRLYTGNGSTQTISGLGFSPDFVWIKNRTRGTANHALYDIVRGRDPVLASNTTAAELTGASSTQDLTSFNSDGFSLGTVYNGDLNRSTEPYVAWAWDAGSSTVTNTQGSITSQVRANPSAGFSIVTYTGTGAAATVGHGLGVAPSLLIVKQRNAVRGWAVYHKDIGASYYLELERTNARGGPYSGLWNDTAPTSTVFSILNDGGSNANGGTYVAYCFAPVAGYSSFGSYTGNGSTDGPFVYTGFRPAFLLVKCSSAISDWALFDNKRLGYNVDNDYLVPNGSDADNASNLVDLTSNGFKLRANASVSNSSTATYIYAAFAENPFQYARAR